MQHQVNKSSSAWLTSEWPRTLDPTVRRSALPPIRLPGPKVTRGPTDPLDYFDHSGGIHGRGHTLRVWAHATELAAEVDLPAWQREAVHYAALWHDIGRIDDGADYYHGARSGGRAIGLGLHEGLDPIIAEAAIFAVTHHCGSEQHAELALPYQVDPEGFGNVFRILKDADALDRVRLGDLKASYLRFPQSHGRIERAWELLEEIR